MIGFIVLGRRTALVGMTLMLILGCIEEEPVEAQHSQGKKEGVNFFLPKIDLSHWKVTLPVGNPTEVEPPEILNYATNPTLRPFLYNDSTDGSLVFYTYPGSTTANTSYSRTELREQMVPGSNNTNWTFSKGGKMKGTLSVPEISRAGNGKFHRTIIMQIHGRLTNEQRDRIGAKDNNAPPVLKIYWENEKVRVVTKELIDVNASDTEILKTSSWRDAPSHIFNKVVATGKFALEVIASEGKLTVILDDTETVTVENVHMEKWSVFENYFKAGNYFQTLDAGAFCKVKFYSLTVSH